ncbi:hypothetical protein [Algisphaera agarilytica]|uniref:Uncharacterized protein n=1 Tax=Algisphaera agarilytica TaxID=1385975 RepID=A0A7X0H954_9BACT|nr:hypothetical protein [Algisphaera agarilytica]MBB6431377.1 hypothetical protein [Algisphaera agarilytica]
MTKDMESKMQNNPKAMELTAEQKFDALKMRYEDHVELLRYMTALDLKIFSGVITIQVAVGSWLATSPISNGVTLTLLVCLVAILCASGAILLHFSAKRRIEARDTLKNINEALGFTKDGAYAPDLTINAKEQSQLWGPWYTLAIAIGLIGLTLVAFTPNQPDIPEPNTVIEQTSITPTSH